MSTRRKLGITTALAVACSAVFGGGCGDGMSETKCRQAIVEKYGPEVQEIPGRAWLYVARDTNGAVWFLESRAVRSADPTAAALLFPPPQK